MGPYDIWNISEYYREVISNTQMNVTVLIQLVEMDRLIMKKS